MEKILVVDDDETIRKTLCRNLKRAGYNSLCEAENGENALQLVAEEKPSLILLDVMMPKKNGLAVCRELRSNPCNDDIYIIMLTGRAENEVTGLNVGADDYVTKPFEIDKLLARIRSGLHTANEKKHIHHDPLTGLLNRRFFEVIFSRECAKAARYNTPLSVISLDIDHFKKVNDTHGHEAGDCVLKEVAILLNSGRKSDYHIRFGGEEFLILLPETDSAQAAKTAEKTRQLIADHTFSKAGRVTVSLGVASFNGAEENLIARADLALYQAKDLGRNRVEVADS